MANYMHFKEVFVVVPPRTDKFVYLVNCNKDYPQTYMAEKIE